MASCSKSIGNPARTSTDFNANITLEDCMCPICMSILIEPVCLPCKHELCMPCFRANIEETSMCCPMCRVRIATWSRQAARKKTLVDEKRWLQIKSLFPEQVQRRLDGNDDYDEDLRASSSSCPKLAEPGEIRKEYEAELKKITEEQNERKKAELEASESLVRKLQEEELRRVNQWHEEKTTAERSDEELARQLEQALRKESSPFPSRARQKTPTLLDRFIARSKRSASCDPVVPSVKEPPKPPPRSNSAKLFFKTRVSSNRQKVETTTSTSCTESSVKSNSIVVDSQEPSTSSAYVEVKQSSPENEPCPNSKMSVGSFAQRKVNKNVSKKDYSGHTEVSESKVSFNKTSKFFAEVPDGPVLSFADELQRVSLNYPAEDLQKEFGSQGFDLQKTCSNLAEHIFKKSCSGFPGDDFHVMYPSISDQGSEKTSSLYSPLVIDETMDRVKGLESPIPDVMLSSCASISEVSLTKSPSVKEVIVVSSDSEMSRSNSAVSPFMSIPVINITDSSNNNTPLPLCSEGKSSSTRALSVTVERLPTPSLSLMHQVPEEEPSTSAAVKKERSVSVESCDSISHELVHFKPIQICPRTPPKRLASGKAHNPPVIISTPKNLSKPLCLSPSCAQLVPEESTEASPVIKRQLQALAAERLKQVKAHSKAIETDCELMPHPSSPFRPCGQRLFSKPAAVSLGQASKKLDFGAGGDASANRRQIAKLEDMLEKNRIDRLLLPENFNTGDSEKQAKVCRVKQGLGKDLTKTESANSEWVVPESPVDDVKKSPGRVYNMRRKRKPVQKDVTETKLVKKKLYENDVAVSTPSTIRTIEDWIRSSQEKQKNDVEKIVSCSTAANCTVPPKRLCTRSAKNNENEIASQEKASLTCEQERRSQSDTVLNSGLNCPNLRKLKQSNNQSKLDFTRKRLRSEYDSDSCSSIGENVTKNKQTIKRRRGAKVRYQKKRKTRASEDEESGDENLPQETILESENELDPEEQDRMLALRLQEQFDFEAKNQVTFYRLRGSSEEYLLRRRARSAATVNTKA